MGIHRLQPHNAGISTNFGFRRRSDVDRDSDAVWQSADVHRRKVHASWMSGTFCQNVNGGREVKLCSDVHQPVDAPGKPVTARAKGNETVASLPMEAIRMETKLICLAQAYPLQGRSRDEAR